MVAIMKVRRATIWDVPEYADMAMEFISSNPLAHIAKADKDEVSNFLLEALDKEAAIIILAEHGNNIAGICGAMIYPIYYAPSVLVGSELWWFVKPEYRGSMAGKMMREAIEDWSKSNGAQAMLMVALENEKINAVGRLYKRHGYTPMEHTYMKGLH
jgi:GNAT superfamily N-acetyltransferase